VKDSDLGQSEHAGAGAEAGRRPILPESDGAGGAGQHRSAPCGRISRWSSKLAARELFRGDRVPMLCSDVALPWERVSFSSFSPGRAGT